MSSIAYSPVTIQTSSQSVPALPSWFGEVTIIAHYLTRLGMLEALCKQVRFARRRFGQYEVIDFMAVLIGYALSGEATLEMFYERLLPFACPFMALFGRKLLPHRSTLSRFLAAIDQAAVEALRSLFREDLVSRPLVQDGSPRGGLWDRRGTHWLVFDVDGTRQAARQRALPHTSDRAFCPSTLRGGLRSRICGAQTWRSRPHSHYHSSSPYPSVARDVFRRG